MVPERNLLGYFYPAFRANMGIQFGGVLVVDDSATVPWELPAFEWSWHEPLTEPPNLLDTTNLHGGMRLQCLEPGRVFRFGCDNDDLSFDLTFEALCKPLLTRQEPPFNHGSHVDQPGRVTGDFTLHGESFDVDCIAMRDRSWGVRRAGRQPKVGYDHGTASSETASSRSRSTARATTGSSAATCCATACGRTWSTAPARWSATRSTAPPASTSRRSTSSAVRCGRPGDR